MRRRAFIKNSAFCAVAVSASGLIHFNGRFYEGDCATTSDILGPFYRPNSPERNNLVIANQPGDKLVLRGIIRHADCKTPYQSAKIELWHCSSEGVYDNESDAFLYRGTTYCDDNGKYEFTTQLPVPYSVGPTEIRPAHFHLMISASGYQNLVTQLYFKGDPYLDKDLSSAGKKAANRILKVEEIKGVKQVTFDVNLSKKLGVSTKDLKKLAGTYINQAADKKVELFIKDEMLWLKNEVFGENFEYVSNNQFVCPGMPENTLWSLNFELLKNGQIKMTEKLLWDQGQEKILVYFKA
jgi:protocatechuate 3,4-dioxygenase beta subunit